MSDERQKAFVMDVKLNDKNLKELEGATQGDVNLLMTTPSQLGLADNSKESPGVKAEFPSLPLLDEAMKNAKTTYLAQAPTLL